MKKRPKLSNEVKPFAAALLQYRIDNRLTDASVVLNLSQQCQPAAGYTNEDWVEICDFILLLKDINTAKELAIEYNIELRK